MVRRGLAFVAILVGAGVSFFLWGGENPPNTLSQGEQPIPFSHALHAGELKIDCQYCHTYADKSPVAGAPSVQKCMGCHKYAGLDKPAVQLLQSYWNEKRPIEWIKIHDLPDHVYFSHKRHVRAGIACQTCHGPVQEMEVVRRVAPLTMGWCVSCHKANRAPRECWTCHK